MRQRPFAVRLPHRRRKAAWVLAVAGPTVITLGSRLLGSSVPPASALFSILLVVVVVALVGGWRPAVAAVVVGLVAQEVLFTFPYGSLNDHEPAQLSVLVGFVVIGAAVGVLVDELSRLTEEQAALRRIATLVATEAPTDTLFTTVAEEVGRLLGLDFAAVARSESGGTIVVGAWSSAGAPSPFGGPDALALPEAGSRSAVRIPITVEGRPWGLMIAASATDRPLPANTEARLVGFTDLLATAIANADSRADLARLADEQAALRRVATLVARATPQVQLFASVTEEVGWLLQAGLTMMGRYEADGTVTIIAGWRGDGIPVPVGTRRPLGGDNLTTIVWETGASARMDRYTESSSGLAEIIGEIGLRSGVAAPIMVEGRLWGVMFAGSVAEQPLLAGSEARLASFTDLVATAVANAASRADLAASRARIVATADATRRRIERDLHDGAQQRLVSLALHLRAVQAAMPADLGELEGELARVADELTGVLDELREFARGIHPAILAEGGLGPALKALARRSPVPVELDLRAAGRLPDGVEVAAYYAVSEMLTNVAKHAHASVVHVGVEVVDRVVRVSVRDDGAGGADPTLGSGLVGLKDRVESLEGTLTIRSPIGEGTSVRVELPLAD
jgi:signal transduction histidine kinase